MSIEEILTSPLPSLDIHITDGKLVIVCKSRADLESWIPTLRKLGKVTNSMRLPQMMKSSVRGRIRRMVYKIGVKY